jgi:hypothetical protein
MVSGVEARRIAYSLAASQEGVIARRQLIGRGVSNDVVAHWLKTGYVFRFLPGVYSLGRPADRDESFWMAGVLYAGDGSILAGESAAQACGMGSSTTGIDVVRPRGIQRSIRGLAPHHQAEFIVRRGSLEPDDFAWKGPVPAMDPARLLIDLCGRVNGPRLRRYFIEAGRNGLLTAPCLNRMTRRSLRFKNRNRLLALIGYWDPSTGRIRSILEGEFKLVCAEGKLSPPLTNHPIGRYEVDAVWLEEMLIVELDGRQFHSDAEALVADSEKTRYLKSLGFRVLRFTWNDVVERPEWVIGQLRKALGSSC